jgi:hypothetical protein
MRYVVGGLLLLIAAAWWFAHGESGYPKDWPKPAGSLFARKGGCPDLNATYTGVNSELAWLLGSNPDSFGSSRSTWPDSRAALVQSADGNKLTITFSFSPKGFANFRDREIKYNTESNGSAAAPPMKLERGRDFECQGGWLYGKHFPQDSAAHGWQRKELKVGRDKSGGLIAGATTGKESSIGWADSPRISLGNYDETTWHRWAKDDPDTDAALARLQSVDLRRYWWKNRGDTAMPIRFTSFYLEPICVRVVETNSAGYESISPHSGPERRKSGIECPPKWGKYDFGEVLRTDMDIQTDSSTRYRIEWFAWSARESKPNVIDVANVHELPEMPQCEVRGGAGC